MFAVFRRQRAVFRRQRPEVQAAFAGVGFAIVLALQLASPVRIVLGATIFAVVIGMTAKRRAQGKPEISLPVAVALSVTMWALLVYKFFVRSSPIGWEWVPVVLLLLVPAWLLWHTYASTRRK